MRDSGLEPVHHVGSDGDSLRVHGGKAGMGAMAMQRRGQVTEVGVRLLGVTDGMTLL